MIKNNRCFGPECTRLTLKVFDVELVNSQYEWKILKRKYKKLNKHCNCIRMLVSTFIIWTGGWYAFWLLSFHNFLIYIYSNLCFTSSFTNTFSSLIHFFQVHLGNDSKYGCKVHQPQQWDCQTLLSHATSVWCDSDKYVFSRSMTWNWPLIGYMVFYMNEMHSWVIDLVRFRLLLKVYSKTTHVHLAVYL